MNIWSVILSPDFLFTSIRVMTPILFAAMACMVFVKGGIDPIGTEGIMLSCALAGPVGGYFTHSALGGVIFAMAVGVVLAFVFGYFTLILNTNPVLAGIKGSTQSLKSPVMPEIRIPLIKDIPVLGAIISGHNVLTYLGLILVIVLTVFFWKTTVGLRIRAVGENESAAKSVGLNVMKYKYIALLIAGCLAGIGGAYMSMGYVSFFSRDMIAGRGWIGMAAESMGLGIPWKIACSVLIFGMADSLAVRLQMLNLPSQLIQTIPYVVTMIAIGIYSKRSMSGKKKS